MCLRMALAAGLLMAAGSLDAAERQPCKDNPRIVAQCFTVHGRLRIHANMRPYLWPVGTKRLLGISDGQGNIVMPPELESDFASDLKQRGVRRFRGLSLHTTKARTPATGLHRRGVQAQDARAAAIAAGGSSGLPSCRRGRPGEDKLTPAFARALPAPAGPRSARASRR